MTDTLYLDFDAPFTTQMLSTHDSIYPDNGFGPYIAGDGLFDSEGTPAQTGSDQLRDGSVITFAQISAQSTRFGASGSDTRGVSDGVHAVPLPSETILPDPATVGVAKLTLWIQATWTSPDQAQYPPQLNLMLTDQGNHTPHDNVDGSTVYFTNLNNVDNNGGALPSLQATEPTVVQFDVDGYGGPTRDDLYNFIYTTFYNYNGGGFCLEPGHTISDGGEVGDITTTVRIYEAMLQVDHNPATPAGYQPFDSNLNADLGGVRQVFSNN